MKKLILLLCLVLSGCITIEWIPARLHVDSYRRLTNKQIIQIYESILTRSKVFKEFKLLEGIKIPKTSLIQDKNYDLCPVNVANQIIARWENRPNKRASHMEDNDCDDYTRRFKNLAKNHCSDIYEVNCPVLEANIQHTKNGRVLNHSFVILPTNDLGFILYDPYYERIVKASRFDSFLRIDIN